MKYFVNVNQIAAARLGDLDLVDCAILDWLMAICNSKNDAIQRERIGTRTWVRYSHLLHDMPLLGFTSKEAVRKRLVRLRRNGYITMDLIKQRTYIDLKQKCEQLLVDNMWKYDAQNQKPSTSVDGMKIPSTPVDGYYINNISKRNKGSTPSLKHQVENSGYQQFQDTKAKLQGKRSI